MRTALSLVAFAALGGSIAWGLLSDAAEARRRALLDEIQRAEQAVSFAGVRTLTTDHPDGAVTTVLRVRGRGGERRIEFVEARLPKGQVRRARPEPGPLSFLGRFRGLAMSHLGQMARFARSADIVENYEIARTGRETVAGRETDRIELQPRRPGRSSYRLWVDASNRFLLRFQVVAPEGLVVFDMSHESIDFSPAFGPDAFAARPRRDAVRLQRETMTREDLPLLGFRTWLPARPPAGFRLRSIERLGVKGVFEALQAWYSDGMASVMLIEFRSDNPIWQSARMLVPGFEPAGEGVARRIAHPGGTLMYLTLEGTEIFVAAQLSGDETAKLIQSLYKAS